LEYTVESGDSVFAIAKKFNLKPESILWANYDQLQDAPDSLAPGMTLKIPPVNGVYYQWQEGDTLDSVSAYLKVSKDEILNWPGNNLDLTNPTFTAGDYIMAPDGQREFKAWFVPQIARGKAGVSKQLYGAGACDGSYEGAVGGAGFIWPSGNHSLSGNDFWSGHLGIDIAGATGDLVWASDSGVVVFAGWSTGGYGNMVMIDHGNGYQTLYGHMNTYSVSCGQSVYQGNIIGTIGSTGNSTGSHLHFEIRLNGQFVDPWYVLP
jgi:murein DD-endopeptidase MepM/ murein hydrolase activator NlpD